MKKELQRERDGDKNVSRTNATAIDQSQVSKIKEIVSVDSEEFELLTQEKRFDYKKRSRDIVSPSKFESFDTLMTRCLYLQFLWRETSS